MAGGCGNAENLNVPEVFRTGTGAIHQEIFMISRFSAPQAQDVKSFACPVRNTSGALRFSRAPADARQIHQPPAPPAFLVFRSSRLALRVGVWLWKAFDIEINNLGFNQVIAQNVSLFGVLWIVPCPPSLRYRL